ncbi:MAG: adenylosuccinate lyase [Candidatus Omnitrophica bacterium]|nr:adenylosuccinate lyase [Candidatus Omnitrophota bacterium]
MIPRYTRPILARLWSEEHRLEVMLRLERLVLEAQAKAGLVPRRDVSAIARQLHATPQRIRAIESQTRHDVIAFLEAVEERLGPRGRYLHFGLTSSDLLDTSLAAVVAEVSEVLFDDLQGLLRALATQARRHKRTVMIGRTHGVHAEPTTFGLKLAVFYDEFQRHGCRLEGARRGMAVGKISGAVGTFAHVSPRVEAYVCKKLGLRAAPISTQIVQRDLHAQYLSTLALIGASLERLAVEIRHLQRTEVLEAEEPFAPGQKGSSAMPHKRNPVTCEKVAGLARLLRTNALAAMENIALWHERDISHSSVERIILPDSTTLLDHMLNEMTWVVRGLQVYPRRMRENLERSHGLVFSGTVLLALMRAGCSRKQAYGLVQRSAMRSWKTGEPLHAVLARDREVTKRLPPRTLVACFDLRRHTRYVNQIFRRVGLG